MWSTADRTLGSIEESGSSFEAVSPDRKEQNVFEIASRHETRAVMKGAPASGRRIDKFARGSVERSVSVPPRARRSPICEPESWVMMPKKVRNVKRAEWKRDDPVEYGEQEPRRQFWVDAKAAPTVARMMAVRGRVSDNSQNLDVLTCAGRSQHASLRLEGIRCLLHGLRKVGLVTHGLPRQRLPRWRYRAVTPRPLS